MLLDSFYYLIGGAVLVLFIYLFWFMRMSAFAA